MIGWSRLSAISVAGVLNLPTPLPTLQIMAHAQHGEALQIELEAEIEGGNAIYVCNSRPGVSVAAGPQYEQKYVATHCRRVRSHMHAGHETDTLHDFCGAYVVHGPFMPALY